MSTDTIACPECGHYVALDEHQRIAHHVVATCPGSYQPAPRRVVSPAKARFTNCIEAK